MDNLTDPIQETRQFYGLNTENSYEQLQTFELSPNEFTAKDEKIGLLDLEVDPYEYLTIEKYDDSTYISTEGLTHPACEDKTTCKRLPKTRA